MPVGPLDDARLRTIEDCLNAGRLDEAQQRLAALASVDGLGPGLAYLSARLLFHRGRLDAMSVATRLRDVLDERPDFPEATQWLGLVERSQALTQPPPAHVETPRTHGNTVPLVLASRAEASLGELDLPRSELPTEPAPPPHPDSHPEPLAVEPTKATPSPWDPLELALASGKREAVLAGLDKLAARDLDSLLGQKTPRFTELAGEAANFFARAPVTRFFAPFDLTLDSVERLDAIIALLVPPGITQGYYALRVSFSAYLGECVREASGGSWQGTLAEPENASVRRDGGTYVPWDELGRAFGAGESLRKGSGPPPHPGAEPADEAVHVVGVTPTPWEPRRWPSLSETKEMTRAITSSPLGVWAARCMKIPLDRTPASLRALDRYASLLNPRSATPASDSWVRHAAVLVGGYVAELICLHGGARFSENDASPEGPLRFEVLLPDGRAVYPMLVAYERFTGKRTESIARFFESCLAR